MGEGSNVIKFCQQTENHDYNTRNRTGLTVPLYITVPLYNRAKTQFSVRYSSSNLWNGLPADVKHCISLRRLKIILKQYLCSFY